MTLAEVITKIDELFGLKPTTQSENGASFSQNGFFILSLSRAGDHVNMTIPSCTFTLDDSGIRADCQISESIKQRIARTQKPVIVPDYIVVTIQNLRYEPGSKWDCGIFEFDADTSFGKLEWREVLPGPRHSDESHELSVKLNGVELTNRDEYFPSLPDYEAPGSPGRWADKFAEIIPDEAGDTLHAWLTAFKADVVLALTPMEAP